MTRFYCTSCSKEKSDVLGSIPAVDRYDSARIQSIAVKAKKDNLGFLILSGEYGLINAQEPIPWYDHLLTIEEVEIMVKKVQVQLNTLGVEELIFFGIDEQVDPSWYPYWEVIRQSTQRAGVELIARLV